MKLAGLVIIVPAAVTKGFFLPLAESQTTPSDSVGVAGDPVTSPVLLQLLRGMCKAT